MGSTDTPFATSTGLFDRDISIRSSIRKVLPALPPADEIPLISQKSSACPGASYSYSQFLREYLLIAEYRKLQEVKIPGVYVIPSQQSSLQWFGVIFIRLGPYKDGVFRFTMLIPESYPDCDAPRVLFKPPVFHPLIQPTTGELDVLRCFPKWKQFDNSLYQVILAVRKAFYRIDTLRPLNSEAATLKERDPEAFLSRVREVVLWSRDHLFDPPSKDVTDPHWLQFTPPDPMHDRALQAMLTPQILEPSLRDASGIGHSFLQDPLASSPALVNTLCDPESTPDA